MARPRVFISSTHSDLRHHRAALRNFLESLAFEPIISETGSIAYHPNQALDESCYRAVEDVDIFVLMIGRNYGSPASKEGKLDRSNANGEYQSITRGEYRAAVELKKPIFVLIDLAVLHEYDTYQKNRGKEIAFAHVESPNVFQFVEEVYSTHPAQPYSNFDDISEWLREQFAGLFRDYLRQRSNSWKLDALTQQVGELRAVADTLKNFSQTIVKNVAKPGDNVEELIENEDKNLMTRQVESQLRRVDVFRVILDSGVITVDDIIHHLKNHTHFFQFYKAVADEFESKRPATIAPGFVHTHPLSRSDIKVCSDVRSLLKLQPFLDRAKGETPPPQS